MKIEFIGNKQNLNKSGVYAIINLINGKRYIGSTKCFNIRFKEHNRELNKEIHSNKYLQRAFIKNNKKSFVFDILDITDNYIEMEQMYLNKIFESAENKKQYYNISNLANSPPLNSGRTLTKLHRKKIGDAQRGEYGNNFGKKHSPEVIHKMRIAKTNKLHTKESKEKIRQAHLGKKISQKTKEKISLKNKGRKLSELSKLNMSKSKKGIKHHSYVSDIGAENILNGEIFIAHNSVELSKIISVSESAIQIRLKENKKRYTEKPIFGIWRIFKVIPISINK